MPDLTYRSTFPNALVRIDGALDLEKTDRGLRPRRLPAWTGPQLTPVLDLIVQATAGVRLALRTTATNLALTVHATRPSLPGIGPVPAAVDLVINGELARREHLTGGDIVDLTTGVEHLTFLPGRPETVHFTELPAGDKEIEIWLPQLAGCDLLLLESDAELHTAALPSRPRWVHYGSSISQSAEAEGPTETWPAATARAAQLNLTGLGFAGNAMLDHFVARTIRNLPVDFISLEIGTNIVEQAAMRRRTFLPAVHGFLDTIRETHPDTPILIISPIPCPVLENRPGPRVRNETTGQLEATGRTEDIPAGALTLTVVREQLQLLVQQRGQQDPALSYLDGRILLRPDETDDLHDGIHPNAVGYLRMGARLAQILAERYALSG